MSHTCKYLIIRRNLLPLMIHLIPSWPIIRSSLNPNESQSFKFMIDSRKIKLRKFTKPLFNIFPLLYIELFTIVCMFDSHIQCRFYKY